MSSKEAILAAIKQNKPSATSLPHLLDFPSKEGLVDAYSKALSLNGGKMISISSLAEVQEHISHHHAPDQLMVSLVEEIPGHLDIYSVSDPHDLEHVEVAVLRGELAVAENAAIWIPEKNMVHRVLPFITQHLILIVEADKLLTDMHQAYQKIDVSEGGYGVFVAGPSKTADIEQSLVIGAHGPRSLTVFLLAK